MTPDLMASEGGVTDLLDRHPHLCGNPDRTALIESSVSAREAMVSACGALATWTPPHSTGRMPERTMIVRRAASTTTIDWTSPYNLPIDPELFDRALAQAAAVLLAARPLYVMDRALGADPAYALPVRVVTNKALTALFADTMFRPAPDGLKRSSLAGPPFTVLAAPDHPWREAGGGSQANGGRPPMLIAMDFDRRLGVIIGSAYCGTLKKMLFTVMNYLTPPLGILPLHAAATEGPQGDTALLLGLSGTGKTTLSADPARRLLGDDEHGWSNHGVANFEYGCYAKLVRLDPAREPQLHEACFHQDDWRTHGAIIENALMYPNGQFDLHDTRLTENSRGAFRLSAMPLVKDPPIGGHPRTILFLTADANGVLPPIARLTTEQAMLWFLMGYTSKLAGTEAGVKEPVTTFSRLFGAPFMPRPAAVYADLLGRRLRQHGTDVYLVNTGWTGGPYGLGRRIALPVTRAMVQAALSGQLRDLPGVRDPYFHVSVPGHCPGVPDADMLSPRRAWTDAAAYERRARQLAGEFATAFERAYGQAGVDPAVAAECPGR